MSYIENLESVGKKRIVEEKGLKITEDAILLSEFMKKYFSRKRKNLKGEKSFLEIGAGQGIISLLLSELDIISKIFAVEIQEEVFAALEKNIEINDLNGKIIPINKNIKNVNGEYDFIFSNPPYKKTGSGKMPENEMERISKYEILLTLDELILEIRRLLKNYGEFFVVVPNSRLNDVFRCIYENRLNVLSVKVNKYKKVDLVVVHGKKGGKVNSGIEIE